MPNTDISQEDLDNIFDCIEECAEDIKDMEDEHSEDNKPTKN